jgi:hypothetical protein
MHASCRRRIAILLPVAYCSIEFGKLASKRRVFDSFSCVALRFHFVTNNNLVVFATYLVHSNRLHTSQRAQLFFFFFFFERERERTDTHLKNGTKPRELRPRCILSGSVYVHHGTTNDDAFAKTKGHIFIHLKNKISTHTQHNCVPSASRRRVRS